MNKDDAINCFWEFHTFLVNKSPVAEWREIVKSLDKLEYFSCPASSKFHLCIPGGLLIHSVMVAKTALQIAACRYPEIPEWKIIVAGLLHDVGKCGILNAKGELLRRYEPAGIASGSGIGCHQTYRKNMFRPYFSVRDLSAIFVASAMQDPDIIQAVLCHDGAYIEANRDYDHKLEPLTLLLTVADTLQAQGFENRGSARWYLPIPEERWREQAGPGQGGAEQAAGGEKGPEAQKTA